MRENKTLVRKESLSHYMNIFCDSHLYTYKKSTSLWRGSLAPHQCCKETGTCCAFLERLFNSSCFCF